MKRISLFITFILFTTIMAANSYIYKGRSSYSSDVILTFDGKYVYKGRSSSYSDIIMTYDGKYLYKGRSNYSSDIIATTEGYLPIALILAVM